MQVTTLRVRDGQEKQHLQDKSKLIDSDQFAQNNDPQFQLINSFNQNCEKNIRNLVKQTQGEFADVIAKRMVDQNQSNESFYEVVSQIIESNQSSSTVKSKNRFFEDDRKEVHPQVLAQPPPKPIVEIQTREQLIHFEDQSSNNKRVLTTSSSEISEISKKFNSIARQNLKLEKDLNLLQAKMIKNKPDLRKSIDPNYNPKDSRLIDDRNCIRIYQMSIGSQKSSFQAELPHEENKHLYQIQESQSIDVNRENLKLKLKRMVQSQSEKLRQKNVYFLKTTNLETKKQVQRQFRVMTASTDTGNLQSQRSKQSRNSNHDNEQKKLPQNNFFNNFKTIQTTQSSFRSLHIDSKLQNNRYLKTESVVYEEPERRVQFSLLKPAVIEPESDERTRRYISKSAYEMKRFRTIGEQTTAEVRQMITKTDEENKIRKQMAKSLNSTLRSDQIFFTESRVKQQKERENDDHNNSQMNLRESQIEPQNLPVSIQNKSNSELKVYVQNEFLQAIQTGNHLIFYEKYFFYLQRVVEEQNLRLFIDSLYFFGEILIQLKQFHKAFYIFNQLRKATEMNSLFTGYRDMVYFQLGQVACTEQKFNLAKILYQRALQYSWFSRNRDLEFDIYDRLGKTYFYLTDTATSTFYHKRQRIFQIIRLQIHDFFFSFKISGISQLQRFINQQYEIEGSVLVQLSIDEILNSQKIQKENLEELNHQFLSRLTLPIQTKFQYISLNYDDLTDEQYVFKFGQKKPSIRIDEESVKIRMANFLISQFEHVEEDIMNIPNITQESYVRIQNFSRKKSFDENVFEKERHRAISQGSGGRFPRGNIQRVQYPIENLGPVNKLEEAQAQIFQIDASQNIKFRLSVQADLQETFRETYQNVGFRLKGRSDRINERIRITHESLNRGSLQYYTQFGVNYMRVQGMVAQFLSKI